MVQCFSHGCKREARAACHRCDACYEEERVPCTPGAQGRCTLGSHLCIGYPFSSERSSWYQNCGEHRTVPIHHDKDGGRCSRCLQYVQQCPSVVMAKCHNPLCFNRATRGSPGHNELRSCGTPQCRNTRIPPPDRVSWRNPRTRLVAALQAAGLHDQPALLDEAFAIPAVAQLYKTKRGLDGAVFDLGLQHSVDHVYRWNLTNPRCTVVEEGYGHCDRLAHGRQMCAYHEHRAAARPRLMTLLSCLKRAPASSHFYAMLRRMPFDAQREFLCSCLYTDV